MQGIRPVFGGLLVGVAAALAAGRLIGSFLFGTQGLYFVALLSVVYLGMSAVGFMRWLKTYRTPIPAS